MTRRREAPWSERLRVWAAAAGRCEICGRDLLEGRFTHVDMTLGELAHIVGAQSSAGSPRGQGAMPEADRYQADNLLLICADHHDEIDRKGSLDAMTIARLRAIKQDREEWIAQVTGLDRDRGTAVIRMLGRLRGNALDVPKATAAAAVLASDDRFPDFPLALGRFGVEIDLRGLPGEVAPELGYWDAAKASIDQVIAHQLTEAIGSGLVGHLSVFAFARLPLLVYLGSRLDDNVATEVYQRHRSSGAWAWPNEAPLAFHHAAMKGVASEQTEGVLVINLSGTVSMAEIPSALTGLPRFLVEPVGVVPAPDLLSSRDGLRSFEAEVRAVFADIEAGAKAIRRLHVFAALPIAAAVALGRAHDPHVRPAMAVYNRDDASGSYSYALEIA